MSNNLVRADLPRPKREKEREEEMTPALTRGRKRGARASLRALFLRSGIYARAPFSGGSPRTNDFGAALFQSRRRGIETHLTRDTMAESVKLGTSGQLHGRLVSPRLVRDFWPNSLRAETSAAATTTALLSSGSKIRDPGVPPPDIGLPSIMP